jgi:hypothetical protein
VDPRYLAKADKDVSDDKDDKGGNHERHFNTIERGNSS